MSLLKIFFFLHNKKQNKKVHKVTKYLGICYIFIRLNLSEIHLCGCIKYKLPIFAFLIKLDIVVCKIKCGDMRITTVITSSGQGYCYRDK